MAMAEAWNHARAWQQVQRGEQGHPPFDSARPLLPDPYLDSLSPFAPVWNESALPRYFKSPGLKPYLMDLAAKIAAYVPQSSSPEEEQPSEETVLYDLGPHGQERQAAEVEVGRNLYYSRFDTRIHPSPVIWGTKDEIKPLADDAVEQLQNGLFLISSTHSHKGHLPLPSPADGGWAQRKVYEDYRPGVPEMNIIGEGGVAVKTIATRQSQSRQLNSQREMDQYVKEWTSKFKGLTGEAYDEVTIALAEKMRRPFYLTTDMENWQRMSPRAIVQTLRRMEAYRFING